MPERPSPRLLALGLAALAALAAPLTRGDAHAPGAPYRTLRLTLDPAASWIDFELQAVLHRVRGRFAVERGELTLDLASGEARGEVVIDVASAQTGNTTRDRNMHRDVLRSQAQPRARYRARAIEVETRSAEELAGVLIGELELLGEPHPLRLPFRAALDGDRARAEGAATLPYVAWGLEDPTTFVLWVAKQVEVRFRVEGALDRPH